MENETDVAAFKDYQPPSEVEGATMDTTSLQEEPPTMTPPPASTFQTAASATKHIPISSSPQPTEKVLGSPYARKLAAEMGINLKVN